MIINKRSIELGNSAEMASDTQFYPYIPINKNSEVDTNSFQTQI